MPLDSCFQHFPVLLETPQMVSSAGLEPTTYGLGNHRSIQLSYEDINAHDWADPT